MLDPNERVIREIKMKIVINAVRILVLLVAVIPSAMALKNISEGIYIINYAVTPGGITVQYDVVDKTSGTTTHDIDRVNQAGYIHQVGSSDDVDNGYSLEIR